MSLYDNLPHTCDIYESAWVPDEFAGASYDDPGAVESDRACWVQPASDRDIKLFQRRDQIITHSVYFKGNPNLRPGYIVMPTSGPFTGATLDVKSCNECTAGTGLLWRAMVEEQQPR